MAKIDYESSNFKNSAIDKMKGKFGKRETIDVILKKKYNGNTTRQSQ